MSYDDYICRIGVALADPTRLRILRLVQSERVPVGQIAIRLGLSRGTVHHHLRVAASASVVVVEAIGRRRIPRMTVGPWEALLTPPSEDVSRRRS